MPPKSKDDKKKKKEEVKEDDVTAKEIISEQKSSSGSGPSTMASTDALMHKYNLGDGKGVEDKLASAVKDKVATETPIIKEHGTSANSEKGILDSSAFLAKGEQAAETLKEEKVSDEDKSIINKLASNSSANPFSASGMGMNFKFITKVMPKRNNVACGWKWKTVNPLTERNQVLEYAGPQIRPFSNLFDFTMNEMELVGGVKDFYDGRWSDFPKVLNVFRGDSQMTEPSHAGLQILDKDLDSLSINDAELVRTFFRTSVRVSDFKDNDGVKDPRKENHTVFADPREIQLSMELQQSWDPMILPNGIERKRRFFKRFDNDFRTLDPLPPTLDPEWLYVIHDQNKYQNPIREFLDAKRNRGVRKWWTNIGTSILNETVAIPFLSATSTANELSTKLTLNQNVTSPANDIPINLDPSKGVQMYREILRMMMLGKHFRFRVVFDPLIFNIKTLLDCFFIKCVIPLWMMDPESVITIDNYLMKHFVCRLQAWKGDKTFSDAALRDRSINYLNRLANQTQPILTSLADLILTTQGGDGWASTDGFASEPLNTVPDYQIFMNNRECLHPYYTGAGVTQTTPSNQFLKLRAFVDQISTVNNYMHAMGAFQYSKLINTVLDWFGDYSEKFSLMVFNINQTARSLSPICLWDPIVPRLREPDNLIELITIPLWGAPCMVTLIDHDAMGIVEIDLKWVNIGWQILDTINEICSIWSFLNQDKFKRWEVLRKPQLIEMMFSMLSFDPGVVPMLKTAILDTQMIKTIFIPLPTNPFYLNRINSCYEFVLSMYGHMGYIPNFYYIPRELDPIDNTFFFEYFPFIPDLSNISATFSYENTKKLVRANITEVILSIKRSNKTIKFDYPVVITRKEMQDLDSKQKMPIEYKGGSDVLHLLDLEWLYQWKDAYYNRQHPFNAFATMPHWASEFEPMERGRLLMFINRFMKSIVVIDKNYRHFDEFTFTLTSGL